MHTFSCPCTSVAGQVRRRVTIWSKLLKINYIYFIKNKESSTNDLLLTFHFCPQSVIFSRIALFKALNQNQMYLVAFLQHLIINLTFLVLFLLELT